MGPCMCVAVGTTVVSIEGMSTSLRVSSSDHSSHRHTRRSPPPYSTTIFRHHIPPPYSAAIHPATINPNTPPPPSYRDTDPISFPAAVRVRVELLFLVISFYFPSLLFPCSAKVCVELRVRS